MLRWKEAPDGKLVMDFRARGKVFSKRFPFSVSEPGDFEPAVRAAVNLAMKTWQDMSS
jgi:hypothetical protein